MRWIPTERARCGSYWRNIPGHAQRAHYSFCKEKEFIERLESEQHIQLACETNVQVLVWEIAKTIWHNSTARTWPDISMGLIGGTAALPFENNTSGSYKAYKYEPRHLWHHGQNENLEEKTIRTDVALGEAGDVLKEHLRDLVSESWNATHFMEGGRRMTRRRALLVLWADKRFASFNPRTGTTLNFS